MKSLSMLKHLEGTAAGLFLQHNTHVGNDRNPTERLIVIDNCSSELSERRTIKIVWKQ